MIKNKTRPIELSESNKDGTGKSLSSILGESSIEINPENNTQSNEKVQSKNEQPETLLDKFIEKTKTHTNIPKVYQSSTVSNSEIKQVQKEELAAPMFRIDTNTLNLHYIKKRFSNVS